MSKHSLSTSVLFFSLLTFVGSCGDDASSCESKAARFDRFVAAHQSCLEDSDCTIIGDCGPNADFTAVSSEAAEQGMRLMTARCDGPVDGQIPRAVCRAGVCEETWEKPWLCCNCPLTGWPMR